MTEKNNSKLTEEIKVQRLRNDKSQEECAKYLGLSVPTYRDLEYNPGKMSIEQAIKLSEFLNWNIFDFFLNDLLHNAIN